MELQLFKIWHVCRHDDIIGDVISPIFHRLDHMTRVHLHIQFSDHILKCFRVIVKNVTISIKHDCRRLTLSSRCDVIGDVIIRKFIFVDD